MNALVSLAFPNLVDSLLNEGSINEDGEVNTDVIITSHTCGLMTGNPFFTC